MTAAVVATVRRSGPRPARSAGRSWLDPEPKTAADPAPTRAPAPAAGPEGSGVADVASTAWPPLGVVGIGDTSVASARLATAAAASAARTCPACGRRCGSLSRRRPIEPVRGPGFRGGRGSPWTTAEAVARGESLAKGGSPSTAK